MKGEVEKVEGRDDEKNVFLVKVLPPEISEGEEDVVEIYGSSRLRFIYNGFLPIQEGDLVSIEEEFETAPGRGKRYLLEKKPLVIIPQDEISLKKYFMKAFLQKRKSSGSRKSYQKNTGEKLYNEMYRKLGNHQKIINYLNVRGMEVMVTVSEKDMRIIFDWWKRNVMKRQLYLLGLYNKEIKEREDLVFEKIKKNPFLVSTLSIERCIEINKLFHRKTDQSTINCGGIYRKLEEFRKRGWFYVPSQIMKKYYPSLKTFYPTLFEEYNLEKKEDRLYTEESFKIETEVAGRICKLVKLDKIEKKIRKKLPSLKSKGWEVFGDITLTEEQEKALKGALKNNINIITGGAGCGKTTILRQIVKNLEKKGQCFLLTSYTGKAVMRIKEILDESELEKHCMTLSKIISMREKYQSVPQFGILIIDEASMVSTSIIYKFFQLFKNQFKIILIGDCNQLDPIDSGAFLKELIDSTLVKTYYLKENKRSKSSLIIRNADGLINPGRDFKKPFRFECGKGFYIVDKKMEYIRKILKALKNDGISDNEITILTPVNRCIEELVDYHRLTYLRDIEKMRYGKKIYSLGDRMMQKKNYYGEIEIMNGEEGYITDINENYLEVTYQKDKIVNYIWDQKTNTPERRFGEEEEGIETLTQHSITNSFAKTIHKSQGSEYEYVIIYLPPKNVRFVTVNMLYTAITRAKKKVWIVSDISTLDQITTQTLPPRHETLGETLKEYLS